MTTNTDDDDDEEEDGDDDDASGRWLSRQPSMTCDGMRHNAKDDSTKTTTTVGSRQRCAKPARNTLL